MAKYYSILGLFLLALTVSGQQKGLTPIKEKDSTIGETYGLVVGISDYQDEDIPDLHGRTEMEDSDSEDEDENEDQFIATSKNDLTESQDMDVDKYLSEMRLQEEDDLPKFNLTENMEDEDEDEADEEDEQVAKWRRRLMKPAPISRTSQDPEKRRVSINESMNETKNYVPSKW